MSAATSVTTFTLVLSSFLVASVCFAEGPHAARRGRSKVSAAAVVAPHMWIGEPPQERTEGAGLSDVPARRSLAVVQGLTQAGGVTVELDDRFMTYFQVDRDGVVCVDEPKKK